MSDRTYTVTAARRGGYKDCARLVVTEAGETIAHYHMPLEQLEQLADTAREVLTDERMRRPREGSTESLRYEKAVKACADEGECPACWDVYYQQAHPTPTPHDARREWFCQNAGCGTGAALDQTGECPRCGWCGWAR
jgi:hypothetical protein